MEIVAAIDSFKGSMTSVQAGKAAAKGIHKVDKQKSMNELKKIIRLFKLMSRSKEKCAQTLLESEQYDV